MESSVADSHDATSLRAVSYTSGAHDSVFLTEVLPC